MGRNASDDSEGKETSDSVEKYASDGSEGSEAMEVIEKIEIPKHNEPWMATVHAHNPMAVFAF